MSGVEGPQAPRMSRDEAKMWDEVAQEATPAKSLERIEKQRQFIIANIGLIGTFLAVTGGVASAVTFDRATVYWGPIPVLPAGALLASALSGAAVLVVLWTKTPRLQGLRVQDMQKVKAHFTAQIKAQARDVRVASYLLSAGLAVAIVTPIVGAFIKSAPDNRPGMFPRNHITLSSVVGSDGNVKVNLGGSVTNLPEDRAVTVQVTADVKGHEVTILDLTSYPDTDGVVTFSSVADAPIGSAGAQAEVTVPEGGTDLTTETQLGISYPEVPTPEKPAEQG